MPIYTAGLSRMNAIFSFAIHLLLLFWLIENPSYARQSWPVYHIEKGDYDFVMQRAKFVRVTMPVNIQFLTPSEKAILNKLAPAVQLMSEIYLRQVHTENPRFLQLIQNKKGPFQSLLLELFQLHFGPWDTIEQHHPFLKGAPPYPPGAAFYPVDMTKEEFEQWLCQNPQDKDDFTSAFTVIRRDQEKLNAVPYSKEYEEWLIPAAKLLREAAQLTNNTSLRVYLNVTAQAFLDDNYVASDIAWMGLKDTPLEIIFGPHEVYLDGLFGYKKSFQAVLAVTDPRDKKDVTRFKDYLQEMEKNLPIPEEYKNFRRRFTSPVTVVNQVQSGGFIRAGTQAMAFNLPNDESTRELNGTKNILLKNVIEAKFDYVLLPLGRKILVEEQLALLDRNYFFRHILFHELSHSLGPGIIHKNGSETTVAMELKEHHWTLEEAKADVLGIYNVLFMMEKDEFPKEDKDKALITYFMTLFRMMRFGANDAAGLSAMLQYRFYVQQGGIAFDDKSRRFTVHPQALAQSITQLATRILSLQAEADYAQVKAMFDKNAAENAVEHPFITQALQATTTVPVDIQPVYLEQF